MKFRSGLVAAVLFCAWTAQSYGAVFAWTYTTDIASKGEVEFEQWVTARWEKAHGSYNVIDFREEFEYGVTDNFQIALYLNHHYVYANRDVPAEDPAHPGNRLPGVYETGGEDVRASYNPTTPFDDYRFGSVSFEAIYRLLSPEKDPIGLAMYFEPTLGDDEKELEWKVIFQKNWFEDRLVWALNLDYELAFEKADHGYERDGIFEWLTGVSYRFAHNWSAGLEFRNHHQFADGTVHETRPILPDPRFITQANVGGPRSASSINCRLARLSAMKVRSSLRTMVIFSVTSMKNTTCGSESDLISRGSADSFATESVRASAEFQVARCRVL